MKIKILFRLLAVLFFVGMVSLIQQNVQLAQSNDSQSEPFRSLQGDNLPENVVYEHLFRMINL